MPDEATPGYLASAAIVGRQPVAQALCEPDVECLRIGDRHTVAVAEAEISGVCGRALVGVGLRPVVCLGHGGVAHRQCGVAAHAVDDRTLERGREIGRRDQA